MSDKLTDMWKSENLINHEVIENASPEVIARLSEILNKIRQPDRGPPPNRYKPVTKNVTNGLDNVGGQWDTWYINKTTGGWLATSNRKEAII